MYAAIIIKDTAQYLIWASFKEVEIKVIDNFKKQIYSFILTKYKKGGKCDVAPHKIPDISAIKFAYLHSCKFQ